MKFHLITSITLLLFSCEKLKDSPIQGTGDNHAILKDTPALKSVYKPYFPIGAAIGKKHLSGQDTALLKKHFASVTAENDMKPSRTIHTLDSFTYLAGDRIVDFAQKHDLKVRGHTLVWYHQTPKWFYQDSSGEYLEKDSLLKRMQWYIAEVLDHYRGDIYAWDVVNEAVSDYDSLLYREDIDWFRICGADYIEMAFRFANEADSTVKLFYNDYDLINPRKREKTYRVLKALLEKGVPIHGVGMQGHFTLTDDIATHLPLSIDKFASLGLEVQITELDISVYPYYHNMDRSMLPKEMKLYTPQLADKLAGKYHEVFRILRERSQVVTGVTFWGVSDRNTWLSNYVVKGRTDYPLLFDSLYQPKKAFWEVMEF